MPGFWQQTFLEPRLGTQLVFLLSVRWGKSHLLHGPHSPTKAAPSRLSRHLSPSTLMKEKKCQVLWLPVPRVGQVTMPASSHRALRAHPLPVAFPRSSRGPQAPLVQQGGRRALLLVASPAAEGRCCAALPPVTAHRHHGAGARREGTPAAAARSLHHCSSLSIPAFT